MTHEEAQTLLAEYARLQAEVGALRQANAALQEQVVALTKQLQTALARIAELEQRKLEPPSFVKPNRPPPGPKGPRKKRAAEHNRARQRRLT